MKMLRILVVPLVCLALGCSDDSTTPAGEPYIVLSLDVSDETSDGEHLVKVVASVQHLGGPEVTYTTACGAISLAFEVLDANGQHVALVDPCGPRPTCPAFLETLTRGHVVSQELHINGRIWDQECVEGTMSPGLYTVRVGFHYTVGPDSWNLEAKTTVDW